LQIPTFLVFALEAAIAGVATHPRTMRDTKGKRISLERINSLYLSFWVSPRAEGTLLAMRILPRYGK